MFKISRLINSVVKRTSFASRLLQDKNNIENTIQRIIHVLEQQKIDVSVTVKNNTVINTPNFLRDYIQTIIFETKDFYEAEILRDLQAHIPPNAIILDVGANIGNNALFWATEGGAAKVHCLEPVPETFDVLASNIAVNNLQDIVEAKMLGAGQEKSQAKISFFRRENIGATRISPSEGGGIEIDAIDNIYQDLHHVDLIKIDVEGHELAALKGAKETLNRFSPLVFVEVFPENFEPVNSFMESIGYCISKGFDGDNFLYRKL